MRHAFLHDREMKAERNIVHDGAVERIAGDTVYVRIAASEACAAAGPARPAARRVRAKRIVAVRAAGGMLRAMPCAWA